jgi:hypothetical protein
LKEYCFGEFWHILQSLDHEKKYVFFCGGASILTLLSEEYNIFLQDKKYTSRFGPRCYNKKVSGRTDEFWNNGWGKTSAHFKSLRP